MISILFSSYNRIKLFSKAIYFLSKHRPSDKFEVVVADESSTDDIFGMLKQYDFPITFVSVHMDEFEQKTGYKKFFNNPALTNNIAFKYSCGDKIFTQGNDIIVTPGCYDYMIQNYNEDTIIFSNTYGLSDAATKSIKDEIDDKVIFEASRRVFQNKFVQGNVTNYLSLCSRKLWDMIGGYDERYVGGQACDDSDFARRLFKANGGKRCYAGLTLHQYHGEATNHIDKCDRLYKGLLKNRALYNSWSGDYKNEQEWPWGTYGVVSVERINYE